MDIRLESSGFSWRGASVRALAGSEVISQLPSFEVEVACDVAHGLPEGACVGAEVSIVFEEDGEELRRIHGVLASVRDGLDTTDRWTYLLRIAPRAIRLSLVEMQEVFLDVSVPELILKKLGRYHFGRDDVDLRLIKSYPKREIIVQYRESDLAFVSRIAEHVGVSFFFDYSRGRDTMVFTDHPGGFLPAGGDNDVAYRRPGPTFGRGVSSLRVTEEMVPSAYVVQDYDYRKPLLDLSALQTVASGSGGGVVEVFSHVKTPEEASDLAQVRAEELRARQRVYEGEGDVCSFSAGARAVVSDHPRLAGPLELLLVEVHHRAHQPVAGQDGGEGALGYTSKFKAVLGEDGYRPPRRTPRPRIYGVVTGVIQPGPDGETEGLARLDGEGRYTVQLHFDGVTRAGRASHPIRMAQPFGGSGQGMHFPLRAGTEVVVAFADGDPDRPMILGAVPNAVTPSVVNAATSDRHCITTASGATIEIRDRR